MHSIRTPGKINLTLRVLGRRDDGFHELETVLYPVPLFDELEIELTRRPGVELQCRCPQIPTGDDNLICRAARLFRQAAGTEDGLAVRLEKRIPVQAGLGGGSSDAAATLTALNRIYDGVLSRTVLEDLASQLGSDVPFFLADGPALATGRGEKVARLTPFASFRGVGLVLVHPGFGVSAAWAYSRIQPSDWKVPAPAATTEILAAFRSGDWSGSLNGLHNSLERPVFEKYPVLAVIRSELLAAGAQGALMSGSGSTVFGLVREHRQAEEVRQRFLASYGDSCWSRSLVLD